METPDSLQPRVIVVDDDDVIRELVIEQLSREALDVVPAGDLATLHVLLAQAPADLIILDLTLPDGDGLNLCRELRANGRAEAIMMVTARGSAIDRVLGLELGADDYLTKPFEPRELVARVRNLLRRVRPDGGAGAGTGALRYACFGAWRLDRFHHRLEGIDRRVVMLSAAEFKLLSRFIENPTVVLPREALLPERAATVAFDRTLDIQISRLRQKLVHPDQEEELILTVRSEGYMFTTPVRYE